jgi:stage IV sporulation protein FB
MKIKIHYSLSLLFFIFIFTGFYLEFFIFFLVIFAHELGHYLVARIYGVKIEHLTFTVLGGVLKIETVNISWIKQIFLYGAGIIVNLLLFFGSRYLPNPYFKKLFLNYNLLLIVFNLLPIYPLDGFLFKKYKPLIK